MERKYPFPYRTRKSSSLTPMILPFGGKVGSCQAFFCPEACTAGRGANEADGIYFASASFNVDIDLNEDIRELGK